MKRAQALLLLMVSLALPHALTGCDGESVDCGSGTVANDKGCQPLVQGCAPGTVEANGQCVPDGDASADATADATDATDATDASAGQPPASWACPPDDYGNGEHCDCECGAPDPDCAQPQPVYGCHAVDVVCRPDGTCAESLPDRWHCRAEAYDDGVVCDCVCGAPDPDCEHEGSPVAGCAGGTCAPDGTCAVCTPSCDGVECGSDGCGGSCGLCLDASRPYCHDGQCVAQCVPDCDDHVCGSDGCGGQCGSCELDAYCRLGHCEAIDPDVSCIDRCGEEAPGGCSCASDCGTTAPCCENYQTACAASPGGCPSCFEEAAMGTGPGCADEVDISACEVVGETVTSCGADELSCHDVCATTHCQSGAAMWTQDICVCAAGLAP